MWDLIRLIVVCVLMVILLRRQVNLGLVMVVAAISLGVMYGMGPVKIGTIAVHSIVARDSVNLVLALIFIAFLEHAMRRAGMMQKMVRALRVLIRDPRITMAALPAFLGLLPSAGGARFSAPLVAQVMAEFEATPERKAFINYWYRHVWECLIPIYPSLIVAVQILDIPLDRLLTATAPISLFAILSGIVPAFGGLPLERQLSSSGAGQLAGSAAQPLGHLYKANNSIDDAANSHLDASDCTGARNRALADAAYSLAPVIAIVAGVMLLKLSVALTVGAVFLVMLVAGRYTIGETWRLVKEAFSLNIVFLVYGVMFFRDVMVASGGLERISPFLVGAGIPPLVILFALPFLVGFSTGLPISVSGVALPLILGILRSSGSVDPALAAFAYASGFVGTILSPAHLCLILTIDYFKAQFARVQNMLWLPAIAIQVATLILTLVRTGLTGAR
ncbi:MAG TPA: DUF401 family protein [Firmicutes bacterium]|nr:DUF401 family protein [Bacillota bacterium]